MRTMQIKLFTVPLGDSGNALEEKKNCANLILCYIGSHAAKNSVACELRRAG